MVCSPTSVKLRGPSMIFLPSRPRRLGGPLALPALLTILAAPAAAAPSKSAIAATIKADVAQLVAGIYAHDVARATAFDAPDLVSMEGGRPPSIGAQADREGLG